MAHCRSDARGPTYVELPTDGIQHRGALATRSIRILIRKGNESSCIPPCGEYIGPPRRPGGELGERKGVPPLADQASVVVWKKVCGAYHASITDAPGKVRFFLIVEEFRGGCHWSVWRWRAGESVLDAGHGSARSPQEAMQLAERAAI